MLEIKNLTYKYENHIALNNINLKIEKGEKIAILGNNGYEFPYRSLCQKHS